MQIKSGFIFLRSISISTKPDGGLPLFAAIRQPSRFKAGGFTHFRFNRGYAEQLNKAGLFVVHSFSFVHTHWY